MRRDVENVTAHKRLIVVALLLFCSSYFLLSSFYPPYHELGVSVTVNAPKARYQVTAGTLEDFPRVNRVVRGLDVGGSFAVLDFVLPIASVEQVQIEPGFSKADIYISQICLKRTDGTLKKCFIEEELVKNFRPRRDISHFRIVDDSLHVQSVGGYPRFETIPELSALLLELSSASPTPHLIIALLLSLIAIFLCVKFKISFPRLKALEVRAVLAVLCVLAAMYFNTETKLISSSTPPFEAADEPEHFARYASFVDGEECGQLPEQYLRLVEVAERTKLSPENRFSLANLAHDGAISSEKRFDGSCRYNSLYVALPSKFLNSYEILSVKNSAEAARAIYDVRRSFNYSSLLVFSLSMLLIVFGKPLAWLSEATESSFRVASFFVLLHTMLLPQVLWLGAVMNQDYLLIGSGLFLALSLGLRVKFLSECCFAFALVAGASKGVYLLPFSLLIFLHYYVGRSKNGKALNLLTLGGIAAGALGLIAWAINSFYCPSNHCYGIQRAGFFQGIDEFIAELSKMVVDFSVLSAPHLFYRDSSFGNFGWLTVPLPSNLAFVYTSVLNLMFFIGLVLLLPSLARKSQDESEGNSSAFYAALVVYWVFSFIAIYCVFFIMQNWCGEGSSFGCGFQKRYELPLYPPFVLGISVLFFSLIDKARTLVFLTVFALQLYASFVVHQEGFEILQARYFHNKDELVDYQNFLLSTENESR